MNDAHSQALQNAVDQFGFNWFRFTAQAFSVIALLVGLALPIAVSVYCLRRHRSDRRLPLWLLLTWLAPLAGPICTFLALRRRPSPPVEA